jgi:hypothetical protein
MRFNPLILFLLAITSQILIDRNLKSAQQTKGYYLRENRRLFQVTMSHTRAFAVLGLAIIIIGASVYFSPAILSHLQNSNSLNSSSSTVQLGTEIKNYPLDDLFFTVTGWSYAASWLKLPNVAGLGYLLGPSSGSVYVVVNFTFRNIGTMEMNLETYDNFWKLADVKLPLLQYGSYYAEATPSSFDTYPFYWGQPKSLMPNQTTNGAIVYQILEGYTPSKMVYPNKDSPTFVINFSG